MVFPCRRAIHYTAYFPQDINAEKAHINMIKNESLASYCMASKLAIFMLFLDFEAYLFKEAGTSVICTNHSIRSTTIQKLAEYGLEMREIMAVSGHKSKSLLHSYWAPSLDNRKRWSNMLCTSRGNARPVGTSPSNNSIASPAKRLRSSMDFTVWNCFTNCSFNGSLQFNFYK